MRDIAVRLAYLLTIMLAVSAVSFALVDLLPGDPARTIAGEEATAQQVAQVRADLGFDRPLPVRYVDWLNDAILGDLGHSYRTGQDVGAAIAQRLPVSLQIVVLAQIIALAGAIPLGLAAGRRTGRVLDRATEKLLLGAVSIPHFVLAVVLVYVFAVQLGWLRPTGFTRLTEDPLRSLQSSIIPAVTLASIELASYQRILRAEVANAMASPYVMFARAKGMTERYVLWRHVLRPSSLGITTLTAVNVGRLLGGAVIVESILAVPGIGHLMVTAVFQRDIVVIQASVLLMAIIYVVANALADGTYAALDPRVRQATSGGR